MREGERERERGRERGEGYYTNKTEGKDEHRHHCVITIRVNHGEGKCN
jgi:hypothetical protein